MNFDFVADPVLREALVSDHLEMERAAQQGMWKTVQLLSAQVIEALLLHAHERCMLTPMDEKGQPLEQVLHHLSLPALVTSARFNGVISARTELLVQMLQDLRTSPVPLPATPEATERGAVDAFLLGLGTRMTCRARLKPQSPLQQKLGQAGLGLIEVHSRSES